MEGGKPIGISKAMWSVRASRYAGRGDPQDAELAGGAPHEDTTVVGALNEVFADAQLLRDNPHEHVAAWFSPWAFRSRAVLDRLRDPAATDDDPEQQEIKQLQADQRIQVGSLGMLQLLDDLDSSKRPLEQQDLWHETQWNDGLLVRCVSSSGPDASLPQLVIDYPRFSQPAPAIRYFLAAFIACLAFVPQSRWPIQRSGAWLRRYPHVVGSIARPSVVASVVASVDWRWYFPPWSWRLGRSASCASGEHFRCDSAIFQRVPYGE